MMMRRMRRRRRINMMVMAMMMMTKTMLGSHSFVQYISPVCFRSQ
jgi:hypothetical protein